MDERPEAREPSVVLSISEENRTILTALIDRTASQKRILDDLKRGLAELAVPYRELQPQLVEAIRLKLKEDITFEQASVRVFGTPKSAGQIRYWRNRWGLR